MMEDEDYRELAKEKAAQGRQDAKDEADKEREDSKEKADQARQDSKDKAEQARQDKKDKDEADRQAAKDKETDMDKKKENAAKLLDAIGKSSGDQKETAISNYNNVAKDVGLEPYVATGSIDKLKKGIKEMGQEVGIGKKVGDSDVITIKDSSGQTHKIFKKNLDAAKQRDKGVQVVE